MDGNERVWIRARKCKAKTSYHLRWIAGGHWHSKAVGTDRKRAEREAAVLEQELGMGTYTELHRVSWNTFVREVVSVLNGNHAANVGVTLKRFGEMFGLSSPSKATHTMIRAFVMEMRERGLAIATENRVLRELRLAFNAGIRIGYMAKNPIDGWVWRKAPKPELRILSVEDEGKLLDAADDLYGATMVTFIRFLIDTWARLSEAVNLEWDRDVVLGDCVRFRCTKSSEDRFVPIDDADLWLALRRLKMMGEAGPFKSFKDARVLHKKWKRIIEHASIKHVTRHDLRRTGISRALQAGMPAVNVQKLAGHASFTTTAKFYVEVSQQDLRDAKRKYQTA